MGGSALVASTPGDHELTISLYDRRRNAAAWPTEGVRVLLGTAASTGIYKASGRGSVSTAARTLALALTLTLTLTLNLTLTLTLTRTLTVT